MTTHDPQHVLETLRNHLSQPDSKVVFLFGAGTSCAVRKKTQAANDGTATPEGPPLIPSVRELTEICQKEIRKLDPEGQEPRFANALDLIQSEAKPATRDVNIEDVLSCVRRKLEAVGDQDKLAGLDRDDLALAEETIKRTIAAQVNPDRSNFPERLPHEDFARWVKLMPRKEPIEVFTTNYDVLIETALEAERVPSFDGFVGCNHPYFSHDTLNSTGDSAPGTAWTRLWKVHGSINWEIETVRGQKRVIRTAPTNAGEMILPSHHKYDESRKQPYTALLERLSRVLERRDTIMIVCGYSFSDEHINAILFDALAARQGPHIIAIQFVDPDPQSVLIDRGKRHLNLMVLSRRKAVVGGKVGEYVLPPGGGAYYLEGAFQRDPIKEGDKEQPVTGEFLLGDFPKFTNFLASLTPAK
jgi:hypothetical protein